MTKIKLTHEVFPHQILSSILPPNMEVIMFRFLAFITIVSFSGTLLAAKEMPLARTHKDPTLKWGPCPEVFPKGCEVAVLHGDPSKPQADVFLKVPPSYVIPTHTHTSPEHMTLVSGDLRVQYEGQEPVNATSGTYLYGPAKAPHKATCGEKEDCVLFISFDSKIDAMKAKDF